MHSARNFVDKIKRFYPFSRQEMQALVVTAIALGFIVSFRGWGTDTFSVTKGLKNLVIAIVIVAFSLLVRESAHRIAALSVGYRVDYVLWKTGLAIALGLTFLTNGHLQVLLPGAIIVHHLAVHRLGKFRYATNYNSIGWIAMTGPLANILLAVLCKVLLVLPFGEDFLLKVIHVNMMLAIFSLLPIPPLDGAKLFFGSRYIYILTFGGIVGTALLLSFTGVLASLFGGLVLGVAMMILFFVHVDKQW